MFSHSLLIKKFQHFLELSTAVHALEKILTCLILLNRCSFFKKAIDLKKNFWPISLLHISGKIFEKKSFLIHYLNI